MPTSVPSTTPPRTPQYTTYRESRDNLSSLVRTQSGSKKQLSISLPQAQQEVPSAPNKITAAEPQTSTTPKIPINTNTSSGHTQPSINASQAPGTQITLIISPQQAPEQSTAAPTPNPGLSGDRSAIQRTGKFALSLANFCGTALTNIFRAIDRAFAKMDNALLKKNERSFQSHIKSLESAYKEDRKWSTLFALNALKFAHMAHSAMWDLAHSIDKNIDERKP